MTNISSEEAKNIGREKLKLAIENLKQAELEGAEELAPSTLEWAKHKIYEDKKLILKHPDNEQVIQEASDDAAAAAAQLLSIVREQLDSQKSMQGDVHTPEKEEQEAIKALVNEGGPPV